MPNDVIWERGSTPTQNPEIQYADIQSLNPSPDALVLIEQVSAWKDNVKRPQLEKLISLIKAGKVDRLFVWNLDRLYRNRKKLKDFLALAHAYGVEIFSYRQQWLQQLQSIPDPWNDIVFDLMLSIIGWLAEDESTTKSERVKMAVRKTDKGTYSHRGNRWGRKPLPKQTITRVLELHGQGKSIRQLASVVKVYDSNNNGRNISTGAVHKIITENPLQKRS
jgi:DNA invertase Pin-like site-specific DNA recombinase